METIVINETAESMIKSLIDVQQHQGAQINELTDMICAIRETMMTNLRFELHDEMMECIKQGFVTEEQYDRITEKMHSYTALKGNHGIQELYEDKFKKLKIQ